MLVWDVLKREGRRIVTHATFDEQAAAIAAAQVLLAVQGQFVAVQPRFKH